MPKSNRPMWRDITHIQYCWLPVAGKDLVRRILSDRSHEMRNLGKILVMNKRINPVPRYILLTLNINLGTCSLFGAYVSGKCVMSSCGG